MNYNTKTIPSTYGFKLDRNTFYRTNNSTPVAIQKLHNGGYTIVLEIPNLDLDSTSIDIQNNTLCIKGYKKFPLPEAESTYFRNEISCGPFSRTFTLPNEIDRDNITSEYKHGNLYVSLPILESCAPKQIPINVMAN